MRFDMKRITAALAALLISGAAYGQSGTATNHAFLLGKGAGTTGYSSLLCTSAQLAVGQAAADPICRTLTGDVTIDNAGVTAIGASKVTNAQLATMVANTTKCNATGGAANPTDCTASTMRTNLALVPGTNVEAWDADLDALAALSTTGIVARTGAGTAATRTITAPAAGITVSNGDGIAGNPTLALADDLSALEGLSGTGIARRTGASAWSTGTLVTNAELATAAANTLKGNATGSTASVTDIAVPSCSGANQAINWTSGTGPGCVTISGSGGGVPPTPGGRLTPSSGVCVPTADVAAATAIYYAPCISPYITIYNGSVVQAYNFTSSVTDTVGLTLTLGSNWAANTLHDAFITLNAGVPVICTVPWTTSTAGSSARATALALYAGMQTNATTAATCRISNAATISMAANQGTYVGSFITNGSTGQVDLKFGTAANGGGTACMCIWNMYNRTQGIVSVMDATTSWGPTTASTFEPLNASGTGSGLNNRIKVVTGTATDPITAQMTIIVATKTSMTAYISVGLNVTNSVATRCAVLAYGAGFATQQAGGMSCLLYPVVGFNFVQAIQYGSSIVAADIVFATGSPTAEALAGVVTW